MEFAAEGLIRMGRQRAGASTSCSPMHAVLELSTPPGWLAARRPWAGRERLVITYG